MPPFSNQFSLSLELTRLVPIGLAASNSVMSLARSLQNSGSDIVIEEDLAIIFGRCRIAPQMASSFRTVVAKNESSWLSTSLGISLERGPGPTVLRGLTQTPYFAMIIQASLLTWVHERNALAAVIAQIFEQEATWNAPGQIPRAVPNHEGLCGVLQACEDQTSLYNWSGLIQATAGILGIPEPDAFDTIPSIILQGAVHMFPLVQTLSEDRLILVETKPAGTCALTVWAHHILGLNVLVRRLGPRNEPVEVQLGVGLNHVIVDTLDISLDPESYLQHREPSITLMSVADKETLMTLRSEVDEIKIDAVYKKPARGYGRATLESICRKGEGQDGFIHELTLTAVAFAFIISQQLAAKHRTALKSDLQRPILLSRPLEKENAMASNSAPNDDSITMSQHEESMSFAIPEENILESARFLFNNHQLRKRSLLGHITMYAQRPLTRSLDPPESLSMMFDHILDPNLNYLAWIHIFGTVRSLSILILAFAHVRDLEACADLPLSFSIELLTQHPLITKLDSWDGKSRIWISEDTWYLAITKLLVGSNTVIDPELSCLVSDRGWSVFLSTFGDMDPRFTDAGYVVIKKGVPCRNGIRKHAIIDAATGGYGQYWKIVESAGAEVSLRCGNTVKNGHPLCGERAGGFLVTLRLNTEINGTVDTRRTGYRELYAALWAVQHTRPCNHTHTTMKLPLSCVTVSGFGDYHSEPDLRESARIIICLTAHSSSARWRALLAIHKNTIAWESEKGIDQVILRGEDCCFQCTVNQALLRTGYWFVIL